MHNTHKHHNHHHKPPHPVKPERKFDYQFILVNEDKPIGCIKGYSKDEYGIDEVIVYICGMKNSFHIEEKITEDEMRDFLHLATSPIFTETFFGSKLYMTGFPSEGRQLFCSLSNEQNDYVISNWKDEMESLKESEEDEDFNLDIYPDVYEEDNEKSTIVKESEKENDADENDPGVIENVDGDTDPSNGADDVLDQIQLPPEEEFIPEPVCRPREPVYQPLVQLYMEDKEYGVMLDVEITGFIDSHKPHHHCKPDRIEFDEDPTDDLIQEESYSDGIDHIIMGMYLD